MTVALWIIVICEVVRVLQNIRQDDNEFVKQVLEEYERLEIEGKL